VVTFTDVVKAEVEVPAVDLSSEFGVRDEQDPDVELFFGAAQDLVEKLHWSDDAVNWVGMAGLEVYRETGDGLKAAWDGFRSKGARYYARQGWNETSASDMAPEGDVMSEAEVLDLVGQDLGFNVSAYETAQSWITDELMVVESNLKELQETATDHGQDPHWVGRILWMRHDQLTADLEAINTSQEAAIPEIASRAEIDQQVIADRSQSLRSYTTTRDILALRDLRQKAREHGQNPLETGRVLAAMIAKQEQSEELMPLDADAARLASKGNPGGSDVLAEERENHFRGETWARPEYKPPHARSEYEVDDEIADEVLERIGGEGIEWLSDQGHWELGAQRIAELANPIMPIQREEAKYPLGSKFLFAGKLEIVVADEVANLNNDVKVVNYRSAMGRALLKGIAGKLVQLGSDDRPTHARRVASPPELASVAQTVAYKIHDDGILDALMDSLELADLDYRPHLETGGMFSESVSNPWFLQGLKTIIRSTPWQDSGAMHDEVEFALFPDYPASESELDVAIKYEGSAEEWVERFVQESAQPSDLDWSLHDTLVYRQAHALHALSGLTRYQDASRKAWAAYWAQDSKVRGREYYQNLEVLKAAGLKPGKVVDERTGKERFAVVDVLSGNEVTKEQRRAMMRQSLSSVSLTSQGLNDGNGTAVTWDRLARVGVDMDLTEERREALSEAILNHVNDPKAAAFAKTLVA
jgi:hypothetical protein